MRLPENSATGRSRCTLGGFVDGGGAVTSGSDPDGDSATRLTSGSWARCPGLGGRLRALGTGKDLGSGAPELGATCGTGGSPPADCNDSVLGSTGDNVEHICPGIAGGGGCAGIVTGLA